MSGGDLSHEAAMDEVAMDEVGPDDDFLFYLQRGQAALESGAHDDARAALERAFELRPESARVQNLLGMAYFKLGLLEAARSVYGRLVDEYPDEVPLRVNLGLVLLRQGRLEDAEQALSAALARDPDHARAHSYLGMVQYRRGDLESARHHFARAGVPDFTERARERLEDGSQRPSPAHVLHDVAQDGLALFEGETIHLSGIDPASEARVRDDGAWQTAIGHRAVAMAAEPARAAFDPAEGDDALAGVSAAFDAAVASQPPPDALSVRPTPSALAGAAWSIGFSTASKLCSDAWLAVDGEAHVRSSTLVSVWGGLDVRESGLQSSTNPFLALHGQGRGLVRVPNLAAVVPTDGVLFVRASALAGFSGRYKWIRGEVLGSAVVQLEGRGTVLLNTPRRAVVVEVEPSAPLYVRRDAFLGWSDGVEAARVSLPGLVDGLIRFEGTGRVVFAGIDELHA